MGKVDMLKQLIKTLVKLSTLGCETGDHVARYYMYNHIPRALVSLDKSEGAVRILSVSGSLKLTQLLQVPNSEIIEANYPEYNILCLPFADSEFDYVVCDQVLEHVEGDPQQAIDESYRVLKPGGVGVFATVFMYEIHAAPSDYWRFSPNGLRYLFRKYGWIVDCGGWGNKLALFGGRYFAVPHAKWHPLRKIALVNDPLWPIVTWIIAMK